MILAHFKGVDFLKDEHKHHQIKAYYYDLHEYPSKDHSCRFFNDKRRAPFGKSKVNQNIQTHFSTSMGDLTIEELHLP